MPVGPQKDDLSQRADAILKCRDLNDQERHEERVAGGRYVRRWAAKHKVRGWQEVLDALDLV